MLDLIFESLEEMMDPEYTRVQLIREMKKLLSVLDEYYEAAAQEEEAHFPPEDEARNAVDLQNDQTVSLPGNSHKHQHHGRSRART